MTDLNAPLTEDEARDVAYWVWETTDLLLPSLSLTGATPYEAALGLKGRGLQVMEADVLKAAGRL